MAKGAGRGRGEGVGSERCGLRHRVPSRENMSPSELAACARSNALHSAIATHHSRMRTAASHVPTPKNARFWKGTCKQYGETNS